MSEILDALPRVVNKMNDTMVFGSDKAQHNASVKKVMDRLAESNMTLNGANCVLGLKKVSFVVHLRSADGIRPDPKKL